ncbi:MAG: branched-chain amino acid ABC transporter permease [Pseudomonadota bacterium]
MKIEHLLLVDQQPLRLAARWHRAEYGFWCAPLVAYFLFPENLVLLSQILITALFALSLDLILGYAGIVSLGHAAFFGVGAYAAGLMAVHGHGDPVMGLLAAALAAAVLGVAAGLLLLRGSANLTRLLVTLGVGLMLYEAANKMSWLTGGADGLQGMAMTPLLGLFEFDIFGRTAYLYSLAVLFLGFCLLRRLVHSPFGLSLRGIHQNPHRMPALGVSVKARLLAAYVVAAAIAGVAGALLAQTTQFVTIDVLSFQRSAELMLIVILGGAGRLYGALLGSVVYMAAHHLLSGIDPQFWQFWLGALLLAVVLFGRGGIMGALQRFTPSVQGARP